jgi:hypothetical protein
MITTLDIVDIGWDRLHGGILSQTITGEFTSTKGR